MLVEPSSLYTQLYIGGYDPVMYRTSSMRTHALESAGKPQVTRCTKKIQTIYTAFTLQTNALPVCIAKSINTSDVTRIWTYYTLAYRVDWSDLLAIFT